MKYRWLLPFTFGVDRRAIETVVRLASAGGATLVPVALVPMSSERRSSATRLEYIQQAKDFLILVQSVAARYHVMVECHEVFTGAVSKCIRMLIQDLRCDSVATVTEADRALLLQKQELSDLLAMPPAALLLASLPSRRQKRRLFQSWSRQRWIPQDSIKQMQPMSSDGGTSQIKILEYCSE